MQKNHEYTKRESNIYQREILKFNHERDTAEEEMRALRNADFNKTKISAAIDMYEQIQKLNSILEKEQGVKKIITKDNIELKAQNQTLRIKPLENQEKHADNLKKNCKAKEEMEKLNR